MENCNYPLPPTIILDQKMDNIFPPQPLSKKEVCAIIIENERIAREKLENAALVTSIKFTIEIAEQMKVPRQIYEIKFNVHHHQKDMVLNNINKWLDGTGWNVRGCDCDDGTYLFIE